MIKTVSSRFGQRFNTQLVKPITYSGDKMDWVEDVVTLVFTLTVLGDANVVATMQSVYSIVHLKLFLAVLVVLL